MLLSISLRVVTGHQAGNRGGVVVLGHLAIVQVGDMLGVAEPCRGDVPRHAHRQIGRAARPQVLKRLRLAGNAGADDAIHRVTHDGPDPPDGSLAWAYRCPCTSRLMLVDAGRQEWTRLHGWPGRYVELEPRPACLIEFDR